MEQNYVVLGSGREEVVEREVSRLKIRGKHLMVAGKVRDFDRI